MRRRVWIFVAATIFVGIAVAWFWLLHTEPGAKWVWNTAQRYTPGELRAETIDGDLGGGALIRGVTLEMEGLSASIDQVDIVIDVDLLPLSLEIRTLHIRDVQLELSSTENAQETAAVDLAALLESLALPVRVDITDLQINDVTLGGIVENHAIEIAELKLVASWKESLAIERFHAQASENTVDATAAVTFASPFNLDFSGHLQLSRTLTGLDPLIGTNITAGGNLKSLSLAVDTDGIEANLRGTISNLLDELSWDLAIDIPSYEQAIDDERVLLVENIEFSSLGDLNEYDVQTSLDAHLTDIEPLSIKLAGIGTLESIAVSSLRVDGTSIDLSAAGVARWAEPRRVDGEVEIDHFSPSEWILDWPTTEQVTGTVSLLLTESRLLIEESSLAIGNGDTSVRVAADIDLTSEIVVGEVTWNDIRWPLVGAEPQVASDNGTISLSGTLDKWAISGRAGVAAHDIAAGQFVVAGHGNREQVSLQIEEGDVLGGGVQGQVEYSWVDNQRIAGTLWLDEVSISPLLPDWPGSVSGGVVVDGQLLPLELQIDLNNLDGTLRGKPLSADGTLHFDDSEILADAFSIRHGESIVSLDGSPVLPTGIAYELQIENLGDYLDDYYGSFDARGRFLVVDAEPVLHIEAFSEEIGFFDYRLQGLRIDDHQSGSNILDVEISVDQLTLHGQDVTDLSMRSSASREQQELTFAATTRDVRINLGIVGAFEDWDDPGEAPWNGELNALSLEVDDKGQISLVESVALALSSRSANIDSFCVGHETETHFCASGTWNIDGTTETHVELTDIPVNLINVFADTELKFDQLISGSLSWLQSVSSGTSGDADLRLTPGTFREAQESGVVVATGPGSLSFDIRDGSFLAGTVELPMPGTGDIRGDFSVLDMSQGLQSGLEGTLDVSLNDLGIAAAFSSLVDDASGSFRARMLLRGTAEAPVLTGDFGITNGKLTYLPIGLKLDDLQIAAEIYGDKSIELTGRFLAGDGRAEITTRAGYQETSAKGLELVLRGENLTVIDVPDLRAVADSDLRVSYDKDKLTLGGSIFVSHADIRPNNLTASRVSESSDVEIVAGVLPDEGEIVQDESKLEILGELEIGLGDDVVIDLDVAKANLTGSATFAWSGEPLPMANGRYDLTGDVQAFGQVLSISEGTIRFPNILADNPFIRVRAEREIYGNSQIKRAGILVAGTAKRQTIEPYTYPLTNEERALTLLVTGSEFDYERGVGAVDFGTYIAPKLFLSYGIGLFDQDNVISARYDLVKGFGVKASSGEKSSGVDFTYRIER